MRPVAIVYTDHGVWSGDARAVSEVPNYSVIAGIHFDDTVVELIGNENVAAGVEIISLAKSGYAGCDEKNARTELEWS